MNEEVLIKLNNIFCRDEGDGGGTSEPYLWVVFFKVDGLTLDGGEVRTTPGNQKNLNAPNVDAGAIVPVPTVLGEYRTRVVPIFSSPAIVGCLVVLLEEDNTPNSAIAAGHVRLDALFRSELRKAIAQVLSGGGGLNTAFSGASVNALKNKIATEVQAEIERHVGAGDFVFGFGDMDDVIGSELFVFTTEEIKAHANAMPFSKRWTPGTGSEDGDYEIRGVASLHMVPSEDEQGLVDQLATPSAAPYFFDGSDRVYVFHRGTNGNLYVNFWNGALWQWGNQGHPAATIKGSPSAVVYIPDAHGSRLSAFTGGQDGHLYENRWDGAWNWVDHGTPPGTVVTGDPAGLKYMKEGASIWERLHVFVVGGNGRLYSRSLDPTGWQWISHQNSGVNLVGRAAIVRMFHQGTQHIYAFVRGTDGNLYERHTDGQTWYWTAHGSPVGTSVASDADAIQIRFDGAERLYVFLLGSDGNLHCRVWNGAIWQWASLGRPPAGITGRPSALAYRQGNDSRFNVFILGPNGDLQEIYWDGQRWQWSVRGRLSESLLKSSPHAITWQQGGVRRLHVAEIGANNHAYSNEWNGNRWAWFHRGTP